MILYSIGLQRREVNLLTKYRHRIKINEFKILCADWIEKCAKIMNLRELQTSLFNNELVYVTDGSFYPDKSHLVEADWMLVIEDIQVETGNFITLVLMDYSPLMQLNCAEFYHSWCL